VRIVPRYDGPTVLRFEAGTTSPLEPFLRQRRRLAEVFKGLEGEQWATQSRCAEWAVRDVAAHLIGVDRFWLLSISSALDGQPTRYLADFDPVATPKLGVDATRDLADEEVLQRFLAAVEELTAVVADLDAAQLALPAEAPPGHVPVSSILRHGLWDAWIHERDVGIPLGIDQPVEDDEVRASLEYAAALGPAILAIGGSTRAGTLLVEGEGPDARVVVEAGECVVVHSGDAPADAVRLSGPSVALVEALSCRAPFPEPVAEDDRWIVSGLNAVFEVAPA
jgi:uncharacterized protein (TIGR03083 family)